VSGGLRLAASFLTRVPVAGGTPDAPSDLARAVPWFPAVGALVGLAVTGSYAAGRLALPPLVAAAVAVGVGILLTGAFHEDGLADLADALGARSPDDAHRIMKDPTHGTFGVLALALTVVVRTAAVAALDGPEALAALPAAHALGRAGAVALLLARPPAAGSGLAASLATWVTPRSVGRAVAVGVVIAAAALAWWLPIAIVAAVVGVAAVGAVAVRTLGGASGDALGAAEQAVEVLVLLATAALATVGAPAFPWWI
jgi:adenosylcobinamide-GDP ribazoletransferase